MKRNFKTILALSYLPCLLVSCTTLQKTDSNSYSLEELTPENWLTTSNKDSTNTDWVESFNDKKLESLITEALEKNFGLEAATYQTNAAKAVARISSSMRLPTIGLDLSSGKQKTRSALFEYTASEHQSNSLSLGASWEIDIWNRIGNQANASKSQYKATILDYKALELSLTGQIARLWFNAIDAKSQLQLSRETTKSLESNLKVLESRYERGLVTSFDLRLARAQTASSRASEQQRLNSLNNFIRQIETLLGRYPEGRLVIGETLPNLKNTIPAGIPADLLTRRPDIAAAEQRLRVSISSNAATQANWLPSIGLTAAIGTTSEQFTNLLDTSLDVWSIFGNLTAPIFQSGRLKGERQQSEALLQADIAQYKNTVLNAYAEVETSLVNEGNFESLIEELHTVSQESLLAEEESWKLYERGLIDITSVLDTQRRSFDSRSQLISANNSLVQNRISLILALGGGFKSSEL